jgi:RNA polymerase sigma factor (sigma-70 family)
LGQHSFEKYVSALQALLCPRRPSGPDQSADAKDAAGILAPFLLDLARSTLRRFRMRTDDSYCSDAVQQWWELVLRDKLLSLKPQYGFGKYARVFMMRAVGRIADRRGNRHARPKKSENISDDAPPAVATVARIPDRPGRRRVQSIHDAANICDNTPSPLEQASQLQTAEEIKGEITRLSASLREPIWYVFYDGLSVDKTAEKLGVSPNAVRMRLYYARNILRRRLSRFRK